MAINMSALRSSKIFSMRAEALKSAAFVLYHSLRYIGIEVEANFS